MKERVSRRDNRRLLLLHALFFARFAFRVSAKGILITRLIKDNRPIIGLIGERGEKKRKEWLTSDYGGRMKTAFIIRYRRHALLCGRPRRGRNEKFAFGSRMEFVNPSFPLWKGENSLRSRCPQWTAAMKCNLNRRTIRGIVEIRRTQNCHERSANA